MINDVFKTRLKSIKIDSGTLRHGIKKKDNGLDKFGEIYLTTIDYNAKRAWKLHKKTTLNFFVPIGKIKIVMFDNRLNSSTFKKKQTVTLSPNPYFRLTIPPNIWYGFQGMSKSINMLINVTNYVHNPIEMLRLNISEMKF